MQHLVCKLPDPHGDSYPYLPIHAVPFMHSHVLSLTLPDPAHLVHPLASSATWASCSHPLRTAPLKHILTCAAPPEHPHTHFLPNQCHLQCLSCCLLNISLAYPPQPIQHLFCISMHSLSPTWHLSCILSAHPLAFPPHPAVCPCSLGWQWNVLN